MNKEAKMKYMEPVETSKHDNTKGQKQKRSPKVHALQRFQKCFLYSRFFKRSHITKVR